MTLMRGVGMDGPMEQVETVLGSHPAIAAALWLGLLLAAAVLIHFVVKFILVRLADKLVIGARFITLRDIIESGVIGRLASAVPALVISGWIGELPDVNPAIAQIGQHVANAFIILFVAMAISAAIRLTGRLWQHRHSGSGHSVTGYVQVATIVVYGVAIVLMIAVVVNRSPLILISGLGALTAVIILVFQDTLLSLVASIELSSTDIVRVGDWIEMPSMNANGSVVDLSLYTVTVRNWDNTYSNFPVRKLVSEPFKNWRGMTEAGGRRIMRSIPIDQSTIHFVDDADIQKLSQLRRITGYISHRTEEIADWNAQLGPLAEVPANRRRMTNLGLFRAYAENYIHDHPQLHKDMTMMVRHLEPGPSGLPLQIYCFTNATEWKAYEAIQADIFDHLIAILPEFGLRIFQST